MSLHKLNSLIACGNINARRCVSFGFGIGMHFLGPFELFFSCPAIGTELARLKADSLYNTLEGLEFY